MILDVEEGGMQLDPLMVESRLMLQSQEKKDLGKVASHGHGDGEEVEENDNMCGGEECHGCGARSAVLSIDDRLGCN